MSLLLEKENLNDQIFPFWLKEKDIRDLEKGIERVTGRVLPLRNTLMNIAPPVANKIPLPISRIPAFSKKKIDKISVDKKIYIKYYYTT